MGIFCPSLPRRASRVMNFMKVVLPAPACPKCKAHDVTFTIVDNYLSSSEYLKFNRWSPENIDIDYDPISGESDYYYLIPNDTKKKIVSGDKKTLKRTPELFIRALKEKKRVELDKNNLYHFKRPTLAESDNGWGKPVILSAMQDIWYLQHLRRGNEAIASEHIVPFRVLYPSSQGNIDPLSQMNLSEWRGKLENELSLWKQDPNHISIFPIPIGQMNIGGDGKILTVTQEMKFIEESIINSLGVPLEFIKGGASWSGSSISLRIIENHFINYRTLLEDFINQFMVRNINKFLGYPVVKVKFKKLRMADDAESKRLTLELATAGKLSTPTLLGEFGYNFNEESENIQNTFKFESDLEQMRIIQQAEVQAKAMEIQAKGQVRAQLSANAEQARQREELFKEELANEVSKSTPSPESEKYDISTVIARYAEELQLLPQAQANALLGDLQKKYPYIYAMVMKRIQEQQLAMTAQAISSGVAPEMLMDQEEEGGSSSSSSSAKKPKRKLEEQKKKPGATKS